MAFSITSFHICVWMLFSDDNIDPLTTNNNDPPPPQFKKLFFKNIIALNISIPIVFVNSTKIYTKLHKVIISTFLDKIYNIFKYL